MATIVQGAPDPRKQALEQGVASGVQNFFSERRKKQDEKKFLEAFRLVNEATSYDDAISKMSVIDPKILSNPEALKVLGEQIDRKFPAQQAVQVDTEEGVETIATRKGDVSGALQKAESMGGRLSQDVEVERQRASQDLEQDFAKQKLKLEERRTRADELRAQAALNRANAPRKPGQKELEVAMLTQVLGVSPERAIKMAFDYEKVDVIEETGEVRITDAVSGKTMILPAESVAAEDIPTPDKGESLWEAAKAGTGPFSALREAVSLPGAYFGVYAEETVEARRKLNLAVRNFVRALSNNPRFPVAEQEAIRKELGISPSALVHPEVLRRRMVAAHKKLSLDLAQAERDVRDTRLSPSDRADAKSMTREIKNFLAQMNVPDEHLNSANPIQAMPQQARGFFSPEEWSRLTEEEQAQWLSSF